MNELAIFAKFWEPGKVKTRLGAQIGMESSSRIYRQFVVTLLDRLRNEADRRVLVYAPPEHRDNFESLIQGGSWKLTPQSTGRLGDRMKTFFQQRLQSGATAVVLIGSDSPSLPNDHVQDAFLRLQTNDVVLGPSPDGGYYLIGMRKPLPILFDSIDWSTHKVWSQTLRQIELSPDDLSLAILPSWYDVDTLEELRQLADELERTDGLRGQSRVLAQICDEVLGNLD